jgi:hypothetical protein
MKKNESEGSHFSITQDDHEAFLFIFFPAA